MMTKLKGAVIAGALLLMSASSAFADSVTYAYYSPLITGNSWTSGTTLNTFSLGTPNGGVIFNKAVFTWESGSQFEVGAAGSVQGSTKVFQGGLGTGANQFSSNGGTATESVAPASTATSARVDITGAGTNLSYLLWLLGAGAAGDTTTYRVDLFNGAAQTAFARVTSTVVTDTTGGSSVLTTVFITNGIPVPPAVWTGVAMLGGMMFLVRRRNRKVLA